MIFPSERQNSQPREKVCVSVATKTRRGRFPFISLSETARLFASVVLTDEVPSVMCAPIIFLPYKKTIKTPARGIRASGNSLRYFIRLKCRTEKRDAVLHKGVEIVEKVTDTDSTTVHPDFL